MQRLQPSTGAADGREAMAAGTERSHDNILPFSPLTTSLVSVTMPMAHNDSVTVAGDMRKTFRSVTRLTLCSFGDGLD